MLKLSDPAVIVIIGVAFSIIGVALGGIGAFRASRQQTQEQIQLREKSDEIAALNRSIASSQIDLRRQAEIQTEAQHQLRIKSEEIAGLNRDIAISQTELRKKSDEIAELNKSIAATVTGGDSYGAVHPLTVLDEREQEVCMLYFENLGNFPLYDVHIEMFSPDDLLEPRQDGRATIEGFKNRSYFDLGNIPVHGGKSFGNLFKLKNDGEMNLTFSISARNGLFSQRLRIVKIGETITSARKVNTVAQGEGAKPKILLEKASDKFPRDSSGKIQWND